MTTRMTISKRKKVNRNYRRIDNGEVLLVRQIEHWDWLDKWVGVYGDQLNHTIAMELLEETQ